MMKKKFQIFMMSEETLSGIQSKTTLVDFRRGSGQVSSVPLFIFLHAWRHFLSQPTLVPIGAVRTLLPILFCLVLIKQFVHPFNYVHFFFFGIINLKVFTAENLRRDALAGTITGLIAVPLTIGICLMSEYPIQTGLITVIFACIIGFITFLFRSGNYFGTPGVAAGLAPVLGLSIHKFGMENSYRVAM